MDQAFGACEFGSRAPQPAEGAASPWGPSGTLPQLREDRVDDPVRERRIHENGVDLSIQGIAMPPFQLDKSGRIPPGKPADQIRIGYQGGLGL